MDDNIWNDRGADDFLRYIKHDFFTMVYLLTHFLMTAYSLLRTDEGYDSFGKRDSFEMKAALGLIFLMRLNALLT